MSTQPIIQTLLSQLIQVFHDDPPEGTPPPTTIPYRPARWSTKPQQTSITVTTSQPSASSRVQSRLSTGQVLPAEVRPGPITTTTTTYYFDAAFSIDHHSRNVLTRHPVQSGTSIVDHAYAEPSRVVLEIGMSDAMDSFIHGQYATNASKSVSAYQTFQALRKSRLPLTVSTRLDTYLNMQIVDIHAPDTNATAAGLKATIVFEQIVVATLSTQVVSARPDASQNTNSGNIQPAAVDAAIYAQHVQTTFSAASNSDAVKQATASYAEFPNPRWCSQTGNGGLPFGRK